VPAAGGRDPETIGEVRLRAAAELRRRDRAVTADDHEVVARLTPGLGVRRAHAEVGALPAHPCDPVAGAVTVAVLPFAFRGEDDWERRDFVSAPKPDPGALCAVRAALERARLLGAEVFVEEPRYRPTRLRVDVAGLPADSAGLRQRVRDSMRRFLDPLQGGDDGDGWPFGEPLRPSALLRVAQRATETDAEVTAVAVWVDGDPGRWEDCRDVPVAARTLVALEDTRVRFIDVPPERTGLR
jgi:predicted phage baseplate assembly protein